VERHGAGADERKPLVFTSGWLSNLARISTIAMKIGEFGFELDDSMMRSRNIAGADPAT
jgi:hypothetical protein